MAEDAAQNAAAAIVADIAAEGSSQPPVSNDPAEVVAHQVAGLVGDYNGPTTVGADGWRTIGDEINIYERARQMQRPHNTPEARRARLFPGEQPQAARQPQPSPKPTPNASAGDWVEGLNDDAFDKLAEAVYDRQSRAFAVDEAVSEPIEEVFQGVDQYEHERLIAEARAETYGEAYAEGWGAGAGETRAQFIADQEGEPS